jgi:RNase P/RNase MRP subunit p29
MSIDYLSHHQGEIMDEEMQTIEYTNEAKEVFVAIREAGETRWTLHGPNMKITFVGELQEALMKVKAIADGHVGMSAQDKFFAQ